MNPFHSGAGLEEVRIITPVASVNSASGGVKEPDGDVGSSTVSILRSMMLCLLLLTISVSFAQPPPHAQIPGTIANNPGTPDDVPGITGVERMGGYSPFIEYEPPDLEERLVRGT